MARAGVLVSETIHSSCTEFGEVSRKLLAAMSQGSAYSAAGVGHETYQFVRTFRPTWALLSLGMKKTESCLAVVAQTPKGITVTMTGTLLPDRLEALRAILGPAGVSETSGEVTHDNDATPYPGEQSSPHLAQAGPRDGSTGPPWLLAPPERSGAQDEPLDMTIAGRRPPRSEPSSVQVSLRFDSGLVEPLVLRALVGRDPAPTDPADGEARLIALVDQDRSISKTHVAVGREGANVWVEDRHSTNGTSVIDASGAAVRLVPGQPTVVGEGSIVLFGNRRMEILRRS